MSWFPDSCPPTNDSRLLELFKMANHRPALHHPVVQRNQVRRAQPLRPVRLASRIQRLTQSLMHLQPPPPSPIPDPLQILNHKASLVLELLPILRLIRIKQPRQTLPSPRRIRGSLLLWELSQVPLWAGCCSLFFPPYSRCSSSEDAGKSKINGVLPIHSLLQVLRYPPSHFALHHQYLMLQENDLLTWIPVRTQNKSRRACRQLRLSTVTGGEIRGLDGPQRLLPKVGLPLQEAMPAPSRVAILIGTGLC
jgi:hypothetical protein